MRVKISYGVELDQIPEEVQNLFDGVGEWMHTLSKQGDTVEDLLATEELEAWKRGEGLARRLGIKINEEKFDKVRSDAIMSYIEWARD